MKAAFWAVLAASTMATSSAALALEEVKLSDNVAYITGGIGADERTQLEEVRKNYNLTLLSANMKGELTGETFIVIKDAAGNEIVNAVAGPMFFAQLPEGKYTLEATNEGLARSQKFTIKGSSKKHIHLSWK